MSQHPPSELDRVQAALRDLEVALDRAGSVVWLGERGCVTRVSERFSRISGYAEEEVVGRPLAELLVDASPLTEALEEARAGRAWRGRLGLDTRDGEVRWFRATVAPLGDRPADGKAYLAVLEDLTPAVAAEQQLKRQETQAQIGRMAGVVAHDVRNALAGIGGALQIIKARLPEGPEREITGEIQERLQSLNRLVGDLLLVARPVERVRLEPTSLARVLEASVAEAEGEVEGLDVDVSGPDLTIPADPGMLRHLFRNLLRNAAEAMGGGGTVRVTVSRDDRGCRVEVADQGPGIPEEERERVFEPFFSTKSGGTGLGLTIARRVVEEIHGGELSIECPREGGTRVAVALPVEGR